MRGNVTRIDGRQSSAKRAGIFEDIGHLVTTERAHRSSWGISTRELTFVSLLNNIPDIVWSKAEQGNYLDANSFLDFNSISKRRH